MDLINLFYSNDLYLINKRVEDFLVSNKIKTEDVIYCDDEKMDLIEMINEWNTISFFNEMRCFWIKNPLFLSQNSSLKDEEIKQLSKYLKDPMDTTILIFSTDHLVETSEAFIQLKKYAYLEELTNTDQDSMFNYTKDYFKRYKLTINDASILDILSRVKDYQSLNNELEKIVYYAIDKQEITPSIIDNVVPKNLEHQIYDLTNALISHNKEELYQIYQDIIENNEEPIRIINQISSKLRELLYVKKMLKNNSSQDEIAKIFGISKGRAFYLIKNAKELSLEILIKYLSKLSEMDYLIKSGQNDPFMVLEFFILGV